MIMLKMYMGFDSYQEACEGAVLVFANNAKEAKNLAYPTICSWFDTEWIGLKVKLLKNCDYLMSEAISDQPHVVRTPKICPKCELWGTGEVINGTCPECNDPDL